MNLLWITNIPFGMLINLVGIKGGNTGGSWLNAALDDFIGDYEFNLIVVTVGRVKSIKVATDKNITYCLLPGGFPFEYDYKNKKNSNNWLYIKEKYNPDIIHVWGTEFTHGYLAMKLMPEIPSVIYMQGLLESIYRYYFAGMTKKELLIGITFRDIIKFDWIARQRDKLHERLYIEAEMIKESGNLIVENNWCSSHCLNIYSKSNLYKCRLNIRSDFFERRWVKENVEPLTIMSNAAGYPAKGLHVLIKAVGVVVNDYPSVKLMIPGETSPFDGGLMKRVKEGGYTKYIKTLIKDLGLERNVIFLGNLSAEGMAKQMAVSNVFVMPSCIENHSSTLIEAMIVGAPCIASYVGGVPEYVEHENNGLLYRFEEYEMLAFYIRKIFSDSEYAAVLGRNASSFMRDSRSSIDIKEKLISIYKDILG